MINIRAFGVEKINNNNVEMGKREKNNQKVSKSQCNEGAKKGQEEMKRF